MMLKIYKFQYIFLGWILIYFMWLFNRKYKYRTYQTISKKFETFVDFFSCLCYILLSLTTHPFPSIVAISEWTNRNYCCLLRVTLFWHSELHLHDGHRFFTVYTFHPLLCKFNINYNIFIQILNFHAITFYAVLVFGMMLLGECNIRIMLLGDFMILKFFYEIVLCFRLGRIGYMLMFWYGCQLEVVLLCITMLHILCCIGFG